MMAVILNGSDRQHSHGLLFDPRAELLPSVVLVEIRNLGYGFTPGRVAPGRS